MHHVAHVFAHAAAPRLARPITAALVALMVVLTACGDAGEGGDGGGSGPTPPGFDLDPVAEPDQGRVPLSVAFDHGAGGELPGDAYRWVFGDGTDPVFAATPEHTFETPGTYDVEVSVHHESGPFRRDTVQVQVDSLPPEAAFEYQTDDAPHDRIPLEVSFDATASQDDVEIVSYEWSFGRFSSASGPTVERTYREPGSYTVELTVTDDEGQQDTTATTLDVTAPDPDGFEITASGLEDQYSPGDTVSGGISIRMNDPEHTVRYAVPFLNVVEAHEPWPQAAQDIIASGGADPDIFKKVYDHDALTGGISTTATFQLRNDAPPGSYDLVIQVFVGTNTNPNTVGTKPDTNPRIALKAFRVEIVD
jgi:PKD repeat protein